MKSKKYSWLVIFVSALFLMYKYVLQVSPSIMTDELMSEFHISGAGLGNLAATFFYSYFVTQLFVGYLLDRFSVRYLAGLSIFISAFGTYIFSTVHSLHLAEFGRALMGVGAAFATVAYMKNAAIWFKANQFAFIGGLLATAAMLGAVFGQAPLSLFVVDLGWRSTLYLVAILGAFISLLYLLVVRDEDKSSVEHIKLPSITYRDVFAIFKNPQNWILTFYSGLAFAPIAVFGGLWGVPFLKLSHHLAQTMAATLTSSAFIGLAVGGPVLGYISDRLGDRKKIMLMGSMLSFISLLLVIYWDSLSFIPTLVLMFVFGFGTGAFMLGFAVGRDINPVSMAATIIGLINTGDAIFGAISEPLVGKILDINWAGHLHNGARVFSLHNYHIALSLLPLYLCIALVLILFIKDTVEKNN